MWERRRETKNIQIKQEERMKLTWMWKCESNASKNNDQSKLSIEEEKKISMFYLKQKKL